jgi:hypothetical protein
MFHNRLWGAALAGLLLPALASAQGLRVVRPVPGLVCMSLDEQSLVATRQSSLPPVLAEPNPTARRIGYPTSIVFVRWPEVRENGYVAMVRLNGQPGWIEASHLRSWHPANGGNATCTPSVMSNGLLGPSVH